MRVTAVPDVRASAICSMFLYAGASRSFHDAGALQVVLLQELVVGHEHERIVGDRHPLPSACLKRAGSLSNDGGLYGLEHAFVDAGGERLDRTAEQHVDLRIVLLGDDAGQRLARREAHEVDLDAGRLLEFLEHRPRPVLGPDRIRVERLRRTRGQRRGGAIASTTDGRQSARASAASGERIIDGSSLYCCDSSSVRCRSTASLHLPT